MTYIYFYTYICHILVKIYCCYILEHDLFNLFMSRRRTSPSNDLDIQSLNHMTRMEITLPTRKLFQIQE